MIYADADFFMALAKKDDWLKTNAEKVCKQHQGSIETSIATVIEICLVCKREGLDIETFIGSLFSIANVEGMTIEEGMKAAHLIKNEKINVFDSFHAVLSREMPIVSSEHIYDKLGIQRIKLENR